MRHLFPYFRCPRKGSQLNSADMHKLTLDPQYNGGAELIFIANKYIKANYSFRGKNDFQFLTVFMLC